MLKRIIALLFGIVLVVIAAIVTTQTFERGQMIEYLFFTILLGLGVVIASGALRWIGRLRAVG